MGKNPIEMSTEVPNLPSNKRHNQTQRWAQKYTETSSPV